VGLEEASNLPNASTFCGRCEAVCPVRIPLPGLMRHWREREFQRHLTPKAVRQGLALWSFMARRPRLYRRLTSLANRLLGLFGRVEGRYRSLPLAGGWTRFRDFPAPEPGGTFHAQWQQRRP
jgi:L-lactate dehydrogenase complex protein LldF